ncbi:MAG: hypothetical protein HY748_12575 [Elusimicrobia bacterium]|nr:hypothetical protein [Elusimicrobiota bacterium]
MRAPLYAALFSMAFSAHAAQGPKGKGAFSVKYIGENGSHTQPTGSASDAIETISRQQGGQGTFGPIGPDGKPALGDSTPRPSRILEGQAPAVTQLPLRNAAADTARGSVTGGRVPPRVAGRSPADEAAGPKPEDRGRYSLWDGLSAPLELPSGKVKDIGPDTASKLGRQDYQTHILGDPAARERRFLVEPFTAAGAEDKAGELFVRFELESAASDAVAQLGRVTGFRVDERFQESLRDAVELGERASRAPLGDALAARDAVADRVSVRGWIPSDKIAVAMRLPGVSMLEIEPTRSARPAHGAVALTDILIGIRAPKSRDGSPADLLSGAGYADVLRRLGAETGFLLKRTIGYQEAPGGREAVIVVSGQIPVRNISKALADSGIVKIASSPDAGVPAPSTDARRRRGFVSFAMSRSPLLVAATLILLLSPLSLGLYRLLQVFIPYK